MPNEPEREIEKTLRDYARQRREQAGAPRELHPATRKMLRDEAARAHPPATRPTGLRPGWFRFSWPRFAVGAAVLALIGVTAAIYFSNSPKESVEMQLSMNRAVNMNAPPPASPAPVMMPAPVTASAPPADLPAEKSVPSLKKDASAEKPKQPAASDMLSYRITQNAAPIPAPASAPAPVSTAGALADGQASGRFALDSRAPSNQALGLAPLMPPAVAPQDRNPAATAKSIVAGSVPPAGMAFQTAAPAALASQRFARVAPTEEAFKAGKAFARSDVLSAFRVEQNGDQIRFIDRDGSVYAGHLENVATRDRLARRKLETNTALADDLDKLSDSSKAAGERAPHANLAATTPVSNGTPVYLFRVLGTNRSLNQKVVFSGEFLNTGVSPAGLAGKMNGVLTGVGGGGGAGFGGGNAITSNLAPLQLINLRVSGRAEIGTNNSTDILANPTPGK